MVSQGLIVLTAGSLTDVCILSSQVTPQHVLCPLVRLPKAVPTMAILTLPILPHPIADSKTFCTLFVSFWRNKYIICTDKSILFSCKWQNSFKQTNNGSIYSYSHIMKWQLWPQEKLEPELLCAFAHYVHSTGTQPRGQIGAGIQELVSSWYPAPFPKLCSLAWVYVQPKVPSAHLQG